MSEGVPSAKRPTVLEVDLGPGVRAGFTTRDGGCSRGVFEGLDLALHVGDDPLDVRANREIVDRWLGTPVAFATQVHGSGVIVVDRATGRTEDSVGDGDALVGRDGAGVGVLVADCVPVLLADPRAGLVAAVHAGRRGVLVDVVRAAVDSLVAGGADPDRLHAHVGPAVCGRCYEVPASMRDEVAARVPAAWATTRAGTPSLDLPAAVLDQLGRAGVRTVGRTEVCTLEDERFYSHRRDGAVGTGRFGGVVASIGPAGSGAPDTPGALAGTTGVPGLA